MNKYAWAGSIAALAAIDVWAAHIKHSGTLSEAGRQFFRTDTRVGRTVWVCSWSALSVWFVPHILKNAQEIIDTIS